MPFYVLWPHVPFYDKIAFSYVNWVIILEFYPWWLLQLISCSVAHLETQCDRWCDGSRYLVPSTSLPVYSVKSTSMGYSSNDNESYKILIELYCNKCQKLSLPKMQIYILHIYVILVILFYIVTTKQNWLARRFCHSQVLET